MIPAQISFGLGEHKDTARALLQREWPLVDLPSPVNEPRFWTMIRAGSSTLAGLAVVANGFRAPAASDDDARPYHPLLEYLVVDQVKFERVREFLARNACSIFHEGVTCLS
ncbi:hypothetical protein [Streptomyces sp. NPDC005780]|uniref:hypothetical protein n=1 Tax=Streptomyces sp. NPDC005780 TaxID=3364730 RepID=UPI00369266E5